MPAQLPCFSSLNLISQGDLTYCALFRGDISLILIQCPCLFPSPYSLINADFCVASSLIAYGALLGKVSPVQLMVLTLFGVTLFAVEEFIILSLLHVRLSKHTHSYMDLSCCP